MSGRRKGVMDPRSAALALDVLHVVERCFLPRTGPVQARSLNQSGFESLCREMGIVNADWGARLFAAIDADNTGAIDAFELLNGLRVMGALPQPQSSSSDADTQRRRLAFRMLDLDRDGRIDRDELREFVRSFATAAREVTEGWVGQFEDIFGGSGAWREQSELRHDLLGLNVRTEEAIDQLCDVIVASVEQAEDSGLAEEGDDNRNVAEMGQAGFDAWCTRDSPTRLRIEAALEEHARAWADWMSLSQRERESGLPLLPSQRFKVQAVPGLAGRLDRLAERGIQPLFESFAGYGQMSQPDFHRCLARLGVTASHVRSRLFVVFADGSNFVDAAAFARMVRALMDDSESARHYLAFRLFDTDDNGFVTETEVADFVSKFFGEATDAANSVLARSRQLFGSSAMHVHVQQISGSIMESYRREILSGIFSSEQGDIAPGPGGQRRVYLEEFAQWTKSRGSRLRCYFDSLAQHLLEVLTLTGSGQLSFAEPASAFGTDSPEIVQLVNSLSQKSKSGTGNVSINTVGLLGTSRFTRHKVKMLQDLFTNVSQDGIMGPPEWRRCLTATGIHNTFVVERLFEIFDTTGDRKMTAKEFTSGLSALVHDSDSGGEAATLEARRKFAFGFYNQTGEQFFERQDCVSFLKSWVVCARDAVRQANEHLLNVYGVEQIDLVTIQSPVQGAARSAVTDLYDRVYEQLDEYCLDVWREYAVQKGERMTEDEFMKLTVVAPQMLEWLNELGMTLGRELEKLRDMNFEKVSATTVSEGTELSVVRIKKSFAASAHHGVIDQLAFKRCVRSLLGMDAPGFAAALFRAIDVNKNGRLSQDEFVDAFTTILRGTAAQQASIAFRIHDVRGAGYLEPKSLRSCFTMWLEPSMNKVDVLTSALEEWMFGRADASGARKGALRCFDAAGRLRNTEIPSIIRKASAREVSMMADALVEHAMLHARKSRQQLFPDEFAKWVVSTNFLYWMEGLGRSWMVTPEQLEAETPPSEKRRAHTATLLASAASEREILAKQCPNGEGYLDFQVNDSSEHRTHELTASERGDIWWGRCCGLRHAARRLIRPHTSFDQLTIERLWQTIECHVIDRTAFDRATFGVLMHDLRIENSLIINRLFEVFDVNRDGNLSAEEVAAGLALLSRGGTSHRLRIVFNIFDVGRDGTLCRTEFEVLLRAFRSIAMGVVHGLVDWLSDVCGLVQSTEASRSESKEFKQKLVTGTRTALARRTSAMLSDAFMDESSTTLQWDFFEHWADSSSTFSRWVERLGLSCLESLVPLETRVSQQPSPYVVSATCRVRRKWPEGNDFHANSTQRVREAVIRHSRSGCLDAAQLCACLKELHIHSPIGHRRIFNLLDRGASGSVVSLDAATCLTFLCGGCTKDKLQFVWRLWDYGHRGFLSKAEIGMLFECLYVIGMDTINATLAAIGEVTACADPVFVHQIMIFAHERLQAYSSQLIAQIVAFAGESIYFERFWTWAEQSQEFLSWLAALQAGWADSLLDYEAESLLKTPASAVAAACAGTVSRIEVKHSSQHARSTEVAPLPDCGLPLMGPSNVYPFSYMVKKSFDIHLSGKAARRMRCAPLSLQPVCVWLRWLEVHAIRLDLLVLQPHDRLGWTNPYMHDIRARFVSENDGLLACCPASCKLSGGEALSLSLTFVSRAEYSQYEAPPTIRLWIHNESANANEECIVFSCQ